MLELRDLARRYGDVVALDGVSFTVEPGQMFGFVGPNGAGKTTTMRIVLGVLARRPRRGAVRRGAPVDFDTRRRFGYMPEERGLYPKMRVRDQLVYLARLHGRRRSRRGRAADRWIERLGLTERAGDRVEQLSLGNQQRVQLAAALVHDPELLVLDEPFSGLDPVGVDVLSGVLADYAATRRAGGLLLAPARAGRAPVRGGGDHQGRPAGRVRHGRGAARPRRRRAARARRGRRRRGRGLAGRLPGAEVVDRGPRGVLIALDDGAGPDAVLDAARRAGSVTYFALERPTLADLFREAVADERRDAVGLVVRREITERVREKSFVISTGVNIVIIVAVVIVAAIASGGEERYVVGYTDETEARRRRAAAAAGGRSTSTIEAAR